MSRNCAPIDRQRSLSTSGSRVVLDQAIEPAFEDGDGRRRGEIGVERLLESVGGLGRGARQDHERWSGHGDPTKPGLGDLEIDLVVPWAAATAATSMTAVATMRIR